MFLVFLTKSPKPLLSFRFLQCFQPKLLHLIVFGYIFRYRTLISLSFKGLDIDFGFDLWISGFDKEEDEDDDFLNLQLFDPKFLSIYVFKVLLDICDLFLFIYLVLIFLCRIMNTEPKYRNTFRYSVSVFTINRLDFLCYLFVAQFKSRKPKCRSH